MVYVAHKSVVCFLLPQTFLTHLLTVPLDLAFFLSHLADLAVEALPLFLLLLMRAGAGLVWRS
jgi:hypothetical protein